jgi:hypothetical protein
MTRVKLDLITDIDMYLMIEKGIRGGVSTIRKRYSKANNKYIKSYDPNKESKYIIYLDANNLYGWAMCKCLPTGEFEWVEDVESFDLSKVTDNSEIGYILEVDLEYPK